MTLTSMLISIAVVVISLFAILGSVKTIGNFIFNLLLLAAVGVLIVLMAG